MGTRITMAGHDTVNKVADKAGITGADYNQTYAIYEAGMIDVLTQFAVVRLLEVESEARREYPPEYNQAIEEHSALRNKIKDALPEEYKPLMSDLEDLDSQIQLIEMDDQFIFGFIEGYKFLRNLNSSYRGALLDVRK